MNKKIYNLMNWAGIEEIVYAEATHPDELLGAHTVGNNTLVQAFFPDAKSVSLHIEGADTGRGKTVKEEIQMEIQDEAGYFAALIKGKNRHDYIYYVTYEDKARKPMRCKEVYGGYKVLSDEDIDAIMSGSCMDVHDKLGAKKMTIDGVRGTGFAVYAPNAYRVSVVGDFNNWDGRVHQMIKDDVSGIYTLFVPGVEAGENYKYEILIKGGEKLLRVDPYCKATEEGDGDASVVANPLSYKWTDAKWQQEKKASKKIPARMNIYEICVGTYGDNANYKSIAESVLAHVKTYNYNYVELMPILDAKNDSLGYKPSSFFTLNNKYGSYKDLCYFVNLMHENGVGVIMQMACNSFEEGNSSIGFYDGTCLYEHEDYRKGIDARTGGKVFQFGNKLVDQYVLSAGMYWVEVLHLDGIKVMDLSSMLYLDYYRDEWIPNMYGGNENLEAIAFIKKFNKKIQKTGAITIAEESSLWPLVSKTVDMSEADKEQCLGFDYVINKGFNTDVISYMETDPIMRASMHNDLTVSTLYQYKENYILSVSHSDVDFGKGGLVTRMPGNVKDQYANLKAFYGYMMSHPGNKQIFMGQDEGKTQGFDGVMPLEAANSESELQFASYMKDLMKFCQDNPAMYVMDFDEKGFEWINNSSANENVISFVRNGVKDDKLVVVINFANTTYTKYQIGVPAMGKYKLAFTSDAKSYGGQGLVASKVIPSKEEKCDGREHSVVFKLPPLSFNVYAYEAYTKTELHEIEEKKKEREAALLEKKRKSEALAKEKARIRASLKEELERKIREAEEAIANGSEFKSSGDVKSKEGSKKKKKSLKDLLKK